MFREKKLWMKFRCTVWILILSCVFMNLTSVEAASKVKLSDTKKTMYVGESYQLKLKNTSSKYKIKWKSSDSSIATVSSKGKVKAKKKGPVKITATYRSKKYVCNLTVKNVAVTNLLLTKTSLQMSIGDIEQLETIIKPDNATNKNVTFTSSNPTSLTVDEKGLVTALAEGNGKITAKAGNQTAECMFVVNKAVPITDISLSQTAIEVVKGQTVTLLAEITPYNATANVVWSSSNRSVATVTAEGTKAVVNGVAKGTADIIVKDATGKCTKICKVTVVNPVPVQSVRIYPKDSPTTTSVYTMSVGGSEQMMAVVLPISATDSKVTWKVTTEDGKDASALATIDGNGMLTAKAIGTVIVAAKAEDVSSNTLKITIKEKIKVTSITAPSTIEVICGKTQTFTATAKPEDASVRTISVKSENPAVATASVSKATSGGGYEIIVKGESVGKCILTLSADGISQTVEVTVTESKLVTELEVTDITGKTPYVNGSSITIGVKTPKIFKYNVQPGDANQTVEWSVNMHTINPLATPILYVENGDVLTVTGLQEGTATVMVLVDGETRFSIDVNVTN